MIVAAAFAIIPVDKATSVHTSIQSNVGTGPIVFDLDAKAITATQFILLHDTTPVLVRGHIALVVPCDSADTNVPATQTGTTSQPDSAIGVLAGVAPSVSTVAITFVSALSTAGSASDVFDGTCVFHADIPSGTTDIAIENVTDVAGIGDGTGQTITGGDVHTVTIFTRP